MRKILYADHFNRHGGAQEYIIDIAKHMYSQNIPVLITECNVLSLRKMFGNLPTTPFELLAKEYKSPLYYVNFVKNYFQLRDLLKKENIDIIHCNSIPVLPLVKMAKNNRQRVVLTCHDCNLSNFKIDIIKKSTDVIICVSKMIKEYLELKGVTQPKTVIYNGFNDIAEVNNQEKSDNHPVVFGMVGRFEQWKGCELFIDAAEKCVMNTNQKLLFNMIGYAENKKYYNYLQTKIHLKDVIKLLPFEADKQTLFSKIDILVNASVEEEPFGRTLVEAGIFNLPVIGPSIGGPAEIIVNRKTGLLFECGNADDLSMKMKELTDDENLRLTLGKEGRKRFEEKFSINAVGKEVLALYNQL